MITNSISLPFLNQNSLVKEKRKADIFTADILLSLSQDTFAQDPLAETLPLKKRKAFKYPNTVSALIDYFSKSWNNETKKFDFCDTFDPFRFKDLLLDHAEKFKKQGINDQHYGFIEKFDLNLAENPKIYIRADLHGDLKSLLENLKTLQALGLLNEKFQCTPGFHLVVLGDYCDRGIYGTQILELLARLKEENPSQVHLIRGNHEDATMNQKYGATDLRLSSFLDLVTSKQALDKFYDTMPLSAYFSADGEVREYVQCSHGLFEPSVDASELIDKGKSGSYLPIPKERELSARLVKLTSTFTKQAVCAKRIKQLAFQTYSQELDAYSWGDVTDEETVTEDLGRRRYALNGRDIRHYLNVSSDQNSVEMLIRAHQHSLHHLMDDEGKLVATTLPVGIDSPAKKLGTQDCAYILELSSKVADWKKRAILREAGKAETDLVTDFFPLISPAI